MYLNYVDEIPSYYVEQTLRDVPKWKRSKLLDMIRGKSVTFQSRTIEWWGEQFAAVPYHVRSFLVEDMRKRQRKAGLAKANLLLGEAVEQFQNMQVGRLRIDAGEEQLKKWAFGEVKRIKKMLAHGDDYQSLKMYAELTYGFELPKIINERNITEQSNIERLSDDAWWLRNGRKLAWRKREALSQTLRQVSAQRDCYASSDTVKRWQSMQRKNREYMESCKATNELGYETTLQALSDSSVANPDNKVNELYVRMRGFQECAQMLGHAHAFYTITCPSRFHKMCTVRDAAGNVKYVYENKKWDGSTPRDGAQYLAKVWSRIRAKLKRENLPVYGFRVAEPNHDGCVHWHLSLFMDRLHYIKVSKIIRDYALKDSPDENGADLYRFDSKTLPVGAATGYILKYIAKNIHGKFYNSEDGKSEAIEGDKDFFGNDSVHAAERISAWRSCHGIRQFQQIGGAGVTVWRELRKIFNGSKAKQGDLFEGDSEMLDIAVAADAADWCAYTLLQGGVFVGRFEQVVKPDYFFKSSQSDINKYGEIKKPPINGVVSTRTGVSVVTKVRDWVLEKFAFKRDDGITRKVKTKWNPLGLKPVDNLDFIAMSNAPPCAQSALLGVL